jgi:hypothetical protein
LQHPFVAADAGQAEQSRALVQHLFKAHVVKQLAAQQVEQCVLRPSATPVAAPKAIVVSMLRSSSAVASAFEVVIKSQSNWAKFARIEPARLTPSE